VLLPRHYEALGSDALYLVATHELLHIKRRDALQSLLEEVLVAVLWFYPWIWWVRGRIRLAREQAVDRATARTRTARTAYVETLLRFAGHHLRPLPTTSGMWRARELRARIDALYKEVTMSRSRLIVAAVTAGVVLVSLAVLGAVTFPFRTAPASTPLAPAAPMLSTAATVPVPLPPPPHRVAQQQDDEVIKVGGDVPPPKKTKHVNPVYPPDAKDAGIQGVVIIEAVIDKEGKVASATVVKSIPELDQAAVDAVLQWEFEPTYIKGKPVSVRMTVTINFTLA
jgi:TonB family protein